MPTHLALEQIVRPFGIKSKGVTFFAVDGKPAIVPYHELACRAASVAAHLRKVGVRPGESVAIALENTAASASAVLGIWHAGATVVSLPQLGRRAEILYRSGFSEVLRRLACSCIFGNRRLGSALDATFRVIDPESLDPLDGLVTPGPDNPIPSPALVQFTSGSTGMPRGVALSSQTVAGHLFIIGETMEADPHRDKILGWLPLSHDMGFLGVFLNALAHRGNSVVARPVSFIRNPRSWLELCATEKATITAAPNFAYRLAARSMSVGKAVGDLSSLRLCVSGAERVSWDDLTAFAAATRSAGLKWESLTPVYGLAETTLAATIPKLGRGPLKGPRDNVALGHMLPGLELRLTPFGETESIISLRGKWLLDYYVTAAGVEPAKSDDGWFETNDIGFQHEGELFVIGRRDEVVIVRGRNVFAEDVERLALSVDNQRIVLAAAFRSPVKDDRFGLAVELDNATTDAEAQELGQNLRNLITESLEAKVSPLILLKPGSIPITTSGKAKRSECRRLCEETAWPPGRVRHALR